MMHFELWAWGVLFLLGAWHGINPAMGWLFAVALGLQKHDSRAVWQALIPIATGHGLAIGLVVMLALLVGEAISLDNARLFVASILFTFGLIRLFWGKHPRWGGMQVGFRDLTIWSMLTASAHGAGFMLLPILLGMSAAHGDHMAHLHQSSSGFAGVAAVLIHTFAYLLVTGTVAWLVYTKIGLAVLRRAWFNLDRIWAISLILTAGITLFISS